jgi:hypothetical protein
MDNPVSEQLAVGEVTFAIPAQSFAISCAVSAEESLPVVTEFVLRMIHTCGAMSAPQIQSFFGFDDKEAAAVIRTLHDELLVQWEDDELRLTPYALGRFLESSDNIPRFFKIRDWSSEIDFDLIQFSPVKHGTRYRRTNAMVELSADDQDKISNTLHWAERSFQDNFQKIMRQDRVEIYKISEVRAGERFMIPLPCTFSLSSDGRAELVRSIDDQAFGEHLEVSQAISDALSSTEAANNEAVETFIELFDDIVLRRFSTTNGFDLDGYIRSVHVSRTTRYEDDREPILGSLHLPKNRKAVIQWIRSQAEEASAQDPVSAFWLAPQTRYWSRSARVRPLTDELNRVLRGTRPDAIESTPAEELRKRAGLRTVLQFGGLVDANEYSRVHRYNFPKLFATTGKFLDGRCEVLLVPERLVVALFHYSSDQAVSVPLGFISAKTEHVEVARQIFEGLMKGKNRTYPLGERDTELDVPQEFAALARANGARSNKTQ